MIVDIECPACKNGNISLEPHLLAQGASFSCSSCEAKISIDNESRDKFQNSVMQYDAYKERLVDLKEDGNRPI
jgi:transposase-like protein